MISLIDGLRGSLQAARSIFHAALILILAEQLQFLIETPACRERPIDSRHRLRDEKAIS
jgi:hypothetical protein